MVATKVGARLCSVTCTTEVVVVRSGSSAVDLRCGGEEMVPLGDAAVPLSGPRAPFDGGTLLGKRYTTEAGDLEVLCTKAGAGSLSVGEGLLGTKEAKPLPSSD